MDWSVGLRVGFTAAVQTFGFVALRVGCCWVQGCGDEQDWSGHQGENGGEEYFSR